MRRCCWRRRCAGPTRSWPCATATTAARSPPSRSPATGPGRRPRCRRSRPTTCTAASSTARRSPACPTASTSRPAWPTCARCSTSPAATSPRSSPSRSRASAGSPPGRTGCCGAFAEVLREHGILWISDEVQSGWGRTGEHFWGWQASGATPDIVTFAKGVGNGLSMGGVIAPRPIMDSLRANSISTFGGSPLTSAGALANLRYLLDHDLQANAARHGADAAGRAARDRLADRRRRPRQGPDDRRRAGPARTPARPVTRRPSWPTPRWRPASGAACWSARAACTATCCASPRCSPSPPTRRPRAWPRSPNRSPR